MFLSESIYEDMGGALDTASALFTRLNAKATAMINIATHNRIAHLDASTASPNVIMCAFELCEMLYADEQTQGIGGRTIASQSNDGVSISYSSDTASAEQRSRAAQILHMWLANETDENGTLLLYAGVDA